MQGFYSTFPEVPVVLMSSWYDAYVKSTLDNYQGLSENPHRRLSLIMGPWLHGNRNSTSAGDVSFGSEAPFGSHVAESWLAYRRRWFDQWLRAEMQEMQEAHQVGRAQDVETEPRVRFFLMGSGSGARNGHGRLEHGGFWCEASDWPLPGTINQTLYLHAGGRLQCTEPPDADIRFSYDFDPRDPVPTIGGSLTSGQPIFEGGGFDQRESPQFFGCRSSGLPLSARPDVLCFETEPLDEDMAVIGPITVQLSVSSNAPDSDFTAKLIDVYPPSLDYPLGFALNLTDGIFRCRYRDSFEEPSPLTPGTVFQITIEPFATANLFKRGHRIRLDISSSNFPKYDVNPNTYAPEGTGRATRIASNTVLSSKAHPSRLVLPLVPMAGITPLRPAGAGKPV